MRKKSFIGVANRLIAIIVTLTTLALIAPIIVVSAGPVFETADDYLPAAAGGFSATLIDEKIHVSFNNTSDSNVSGNFIVASYNGGKLVYMESQPFNAPAGSVDFAEFEIELNGVYTHTAFCWDENYVPLAQSISFDPAIEKANILYTNITGATAATVFLDRQVPVTYEDFIVEVCLEDSWTELSGVAGASPATGEFAVAGVSDLYAYIIIGCTLEDGDEIVVYVNSDSQWLNLYGWSYDRRVVAIPVISNAVMTRISEDYAEFRFGSDLGGILSYIVTAADAPAPDAAQVISIAQGGGNAGYLANVVNSGLYSIDGWYDNNLWLYLGDDAEYGDAFKLYFIAAGNQGDKAGMAAVDISAQQEVPLASGLYAWSELPEHKIENLNKTALTVYGNILDPSSALLYISNDQQSAARFKVGEDISGALLSDYTLLTPLEIDDRGGWAYIPTSPIEVENGRYTLVNLDAQGKVINAGTAGIWPSDILNALILSDLSGMTIKSYSEDGSWSAVNLASPIANNGEMIFLSAATSSAASPGNLILYTEEKGEFTISPWGQEYYLPPTTGYVAEINCAGLNWVSGIATAPPLVWNSLDYTLERNKAYFADLSLNWNIRLTTSDTYDSNVRKSVLLDWDTNNPVDPDNPDYRLYGLMSAVSEVLQAVDGVIGDTIMFTTADTPDFQTAIPKIEILNDVAFTQYVVANMILEKEGITVTVNPAAVVHINNIRFENYSHYVPDDEGIHEPIGPGVPMYLSYENGMLIFDDIGFPLSVPDTIEVMYFGYVYTLDIAENGATIDISRLGAGTDINMHVRQSRTVRFDTGEGVVATSGINGSINIGSLGSGLAFTTGEWITISASDPPDRYFTLTAPYNDENDDTFYWVPLYIADWKDPPAEKSNIVDAYITGATTVTVVLDQPTPVTYADFAIEVGVENVFTLLTGVAGTTPAPGEFAIAGVSDDYIYIVLGSALEDRHGILLNASKGSELLNYSIGFYDQRIINTPVISNTVMTRVSYDYAEFRFESNIYGTLGYIVTAAGAPAPNAAQIESIAQNEGNAGYTASVVDFGLFSVDGWYDNSLWLYLGDDAKIGDAFTFYFITTTLQGELSDVTAVNISAQQEVPFAYGLRAWSTLPERKTENVGKTVLNIEGAIENPESALLYISNSEQRVTRIRVGEDISGALSSDYTLLTPSSLNVEDGTAYISTSPMKIEPGRHTLVQVDSQGKVIMAGTAGVWEYDTLTALVFSDLDGKTVKSFSMDNGWSAVNLPTPIVNNGEMIFLPTSPGNLILYTEEKGDLTVSEWGYSYYPSPTSGYSANLDYGGLNWVNSMATVPPLVWNPIEPDVPQVRLALVLSFDRYLEPDGDKYVEKYEVTIVDLEGRVTTVPTTKDMYDGKFAAGTTVPGGYEGKVWAFDIINNDYVFSDPGTQDATRTYIIEDRVEEVHNRDTILYPYPGLTVQRANSATIFVVVNFGLYGKPDGTVSVVTGVNNVNDYTAWTGWIIAVSFNTDGTANNIANIVYIYDVEAGVEP